MKHLYLFILSIFCSLSAQTSLFAQSLSGKYNAQRPIIVVGDWDKPPYEFLNDKGQPTGTHIDIMRAILEKRLELPVQFVLKEWGNAIKTFERGDADLILANIHRYDSIPYAISRNIINYNRVCAAALGDSTGIISAKKLLKEGVSLKPSDFIANLFRDIDSTYMNKVEFQSPKVALTGLTTGDTKFFVWYERTLQWKLKELNLEGICLHEVDMPVCEVHVIGRDQKLIDAVDEAYSRLKQSGEIERINNRWLHPEDQTLEQNTSKHLLVVMLAVAVVFVLLLLTRLARSQVSKATRTSSELNEMMIKALRMGRYHITEYDIANDRMVNSYGNLLPDKGLTLAEFTSRIHPDEQAEFLKKMEQLKKGVARKFELDKRWNAATSGQPFWRSFHGHAVVELDAEDKPAFVINAVYDVTRDSVDDNAAYVQREKFEQLMRHTPIAMSFYDKNGWLIDLNDAMKELCGFDDAHPEAENFWRTARLFDKPLFRGVYNPGDCHDLLACQHMDYADISVNRYIEYHIHPIFDDSGGVVSYLVSAFDVSDERERSIKFQQQVREIEKSDKLISQYESNLHYLLENSKAYIWRADFRSRRLHYSRSLHEDLFVLTFDEYLETIHPDQKDYVTALLSKPDSLNEVYTETIHFSHTPYSPGETWEFVAGKVNRDASGAVYEHVGVVYDVTDLVLARRGLKEEAERAENSGRQKSAFLASMTHELRTPLNSIVGFSDLLGSVETLEERREFIRIIRNNCDMLLRLINDILEASNIDDGQNSITLSLTDFSREFNVVCETLQLRVQEPQVEFVKDNPYETCKVCLDMGRISQVMTNFVTNAVKYTHQGHIKLGYRITPDAGSADEFRESGLYIYCEDTGSGIPKEKQQSVFERFVKLNEFVQGTGLGLAICKSIAERFHGRIGVNSEGEGKGSTFWIWIPCEIQEN